MPSQRSSFHLHGVVPLTLVSFALLLYPATHHRTLKIDGPIVRTKAEAQAWSTQALHDQRCIPSMTSVSLHAQGDERRTGDPGPWFASLSCNQHPQLYWRLGIIFLLLYAAFALVARLAFAPTKAR